MQRFDEDDFMLGTFSSPGMHDLIKRTQENVDDH